MSKNGRARTPARAPEAALDVTRTPLEQNPHAQIREESGGSIKADSSSRVSVLFPLDERVSVVWIPTAWTAYHTIIINMIMIMIIIVMIMIIMIIITTTINNRNNNSNLSHTY